MEGAIGISNRQDEASTVEIVPFLSHAEHVARSAYADCYVKKAGRLARKRRVSKHYLIYWGFMDASIASVFTPCVLRPLKDKCA